MPRAKHTQQLDTQQLVALGQRTMGGGAGDAAAPPRPEVRLRVHASKPAKNKARRKRQ
jgi:hypothetical protein